MDFLNGKIRPMYRKYLAAAFGSAMITSVYSIVDMAMVGQYHGPGNGGAGGAGRSGLGRTAGFSGACADFFRGGCVHAGAGGEVYGADPVCVPAVFVQPDALGVFAQRQEPGPCHTGRAVGGLFNVFGDYFFVFTCDMGIYGAGLATAIGSGISFLVMMTHFVRSKNILRLVRPERLGEKLGKIAVTGFSTFFIDVAMGILTVLFNRQIMKYLGSDALAIYGPIIQVSTFVQCCAYSIGQAAQPIISTNFGAGKGQRIRQTLYLALWTEAFFGVFWTTLSMAYPNLYMAGLRQRTLLDGNDLFIKFKGALTEQYVCQQLKTIEDLGVYYYTNDRGSCEIHIF